MRRSDRFRASICCRRPGSKKTSSIDVQVLRLRRKLEVDPKAPRVIIRTERGVDYVFAIPVEQSRWADWRSIPQNR